MKRLLLSIILGITFPVIGLLAIGIGTEYLQPSILTVVEIYGHSVPGLLLAPFSLPFYFDAVAREHRIAPEIVDTFLFRLLSMILFNWVLYGIIFYFLLGFAKRFKKQPSENHELPPQPKAII